MNLLNPREPVSTWSHGVWLMLVDMGGSAEQSNRSGPGAAPLDG